MTEHDTPDADTVASDRERWVDQLLEELDSTPDAVVPSPHLDRLVRAIKKRLYSQMAMDERTRRAVETGATMTKMIVVDEQGLPRDFGLGVGVSGPVFYRPPFGHLVVAVIRNRGALRLDVLAQMAPRAFLDASAPEGYIALIEREP